MKHIKNRIKVLEKRILHNEFVNDEHWRERGDQAIKDKKELKRLKSY